MANTEWIRGHVVQDDRPCWGPLVRTLGHDLAGRFMWMFEIKLADETSVHAYKHMTTRRYLHLDATGRAFDFVENGRYREVAIPVTLARTFAGLASSVPGEFDTEKLWAAIRRLRAACAPSP